MNLKSFTFHLRIYYLVYRTLHSNNLSPRVGYEPVPGRKAYLFAVFCLCFIRERFAIIERVDATFYMAHSDNAL